MQKYISTFGIEIHAELSTVTKAFSTARVDFNAVPNTAINPIDLGYPGYKPTVNKKMVEYSYRLAKILDMEISEILFFDRKSYFYPDLPKGFQITQYFKPIGINGKFKILTNGNIKEISITEIHMEEDTAKQIKTNEGTLFDFNRSGIPLIEIVSGHDELKSIDEVISYIKQMRQQLVIMGINDGKLEEGSFRVDINVSIRKESDSKYGKRTEIKNLNSFSNIRKALNFEIERHTLLIESNKEVKCMTVRYDEELEKTVAMRLKDSGENYNFIPEGNITPIKLTKELTELFNQKALKDIKIIDFINLYKDKLNNNSLQVITSVKELFELFISLEKKIGYIDSSNFIVNNIKSAINYSDNKTFKLDVKEVEQIILLKKQGKIDGKNTKILISKMFNESIKLDLDKLNNKRLISNEEIEKIIIKLILENKELIDKDINDRPERVKRLLMGQFMKETKGKASPQIANKLFQKILWEK